jgi:hypothetical protein
MSDIPLPITPPIPPKGVTFTEIYDCKCSASGGPDLPDYCPEHGTPPVPRVRAKFMCNSYETSLQHAGRDAAGNLQPPVECRTVKLSAVYDGSPENKRFFRFTPSGQISLGTLNPEAWRVFELGKEFYVDFIPTDQPKEAQ